MYNSWVFDYILIFVFIVVLLFHPSSFYSLLNLINLHFIGILILFHGIWTNHGKICFLQSGFKYVLFLYMVYAAYVLLFWQPTHTCLVNHGIQVFRFGTKDGKLADCLMKKHNYILQPVSGNAKYLKMRQNESADSIEPFQKAAVNLDDVTLCLSKVQF